MQQWYTTTYGKKTTHPHIHAIVLERFLAL